jgi:hypothetical protein
MCSNHHDLLEIAVIESLPLRQSFATALLKTPPKQVSAAIYSIDT